ncbi:MAG: TRAP transporter large permease [Pseudomonadota bacterium]
MDLSLIIPLLALLVFLAGGMWIFSALLITAILLLTVSAGLDPERAGILGSTVLVRASRSWELSAIPLFLFMGELLLRGGTAARLFTGLVPVVGRLPGGLLHINVVGCTLFAAVSGSSTATTATVGRVSLPQLDQMGYPRMLAIGSLAGAGSFGLLIPPSIAMIIYGVLSETSVARLFAAGLVPGLVVAALYSLYVAFRHPRASDHSGTWRDTLGLLPVAGLVALVLGAIYLGFASPTEAAAVGVAGALALIALEGRLNRAVIYDSLAAAARLTAVLGAVVIAASVLASAAGMVALPRSFAAWVTGFELSAGMLLLALAVFYIVLGLFLDGVSILVLTLPVVLPVVQAAGIDLVWFGVFLVLMIEMGLMTPPVGFNLFVLQSISGEPVLRIAKAALPFFVIMGVAVLLFTLFPQIVLFLPDLLYN